MTKIFAALLALLGMAVFSCHSGRWEKGTVEELINYSDDIFYSYMKFRPAHEKLMYSLDDVAAGMLAQSEGRVDTGVERMRAVDTGMLRMLLGEARRARDSSLNLLREVEDVDTAIRLKVALMAYMEAAQHFYDSDYDKLISLAVEPRKADSLATLREVRRGIHEVQDRNRELVQGFKAFKKKYRIMTAFLAPGEKVKMPDLWGEEDRGEKDRGERGDTVVRDTLVRDTSKGK